MGQLKLKQWFFAFVLSILKLADLRMVVDRLQAAVGLGSGRNGGVRIL